MKRFISAMLAVFMVAALFCVPAVAWTKPATYENTSELFDTDLPTRYALKGTPEVDGVKEAAWANAYTYRVDRSQNAILGGLVPMGTMADVYMMWDENYLYILEERFCETIVGNTSYYNFSAQGSAHYVVLPSDYTDDEDTTNNGGTAMIYTIPCTTLTQQAPIGNTNLNGRIKWYTSASRATAQANTTGPNYTLFTGEDAESWEGATSKTALTETGYLMETRIPWDFLDQRCSEAFTPEVNAIIGIGLNISRGQANANNLPRMSDTEGFQQLQLVEGTNPTVKPLIADLSWYDVGQSTFTITTAEQLLGLVELTNLHGSYAQWFTANAKIGTTDATTLTNGKTFKLGNNINLNPGTTFNADGTWTGNAPVSGWGAIQAFTGTFDGQGYTISGMYASNGLTNGSHADEFGFVGRMRTGATIKNLNLTNGYLKGAGSDSLGSVVGVMHGSRADGNLTLSNITSDVTIAGINQSSKTGGIYGAGYVSGKNVTVYLTDILYTGTVTGNAPGSIAGRLNSHGGSGAFNIVMDNCYGIEGVPTNGTWGGQTPSTLTGANAPVVQKTEATDGLFSARVLGLLTEEDVTNCANVGFVVTVKVGEVTYDAAPYTTTTAWTAVQAAGETVTAASLTADYLYGLAISNLPVPTAEEDVTITVTMTRTLGTDAVVSAASYSITYTAADFAVVE